MTSAAIPLSSSAEAPAASPSRLIEFLLVGGATLVLFPLSWIVRKFVGLDPSELAVGFLTFYAAYVVNDPHFTVTYFLFYKDARRRAFDPGVPLASRVRWVVSGVLVPAVLVAWAATSLALGSAQGLGWMVQVMFLLVGWHYVKQGFGVVTVLSSRHGVRVSDRERLAILVHCFAGWAYAWANPAMPAGEFEERGVVYWAPARPHWFELVALVVLMASSAWLVMTLVTEAKKRGRFLPLAPLGGFLITVWAWTIYSSIDPLLRYAIPALHSIQYLYFVWLMKRNEARSQEGPPSFGRPVAVRVGGLAVGALVLGWLLFHGVPGFLDGAFVPRARRNVIVGPLGETPFFAAFYVFVNIHHYFMDHVVWRRDNPDTAYLRGP